ncbi:hypothetical protein WA538_000458 [Blastocystis sp. DL]
MFTRIVHVSRQGVVSLARANRLSHVSGYGVVRFFSASLPEHIDVTMPALSPTMTQGGISSWNVKEGDAVQPGDVLAQISTDKSTLDFTTQEEGYVAKILMPEGSENVNIGEPIAIIVENKEDIPKFANVTKESLEGKDGESAPAVPAAAPAAAPTPTPTPATPTPTPATPAPAPTTPATPATRTFISPLAKTILRESGAKVDLSKLQGSGPNGRVIAKDVLAAISATTTPTAPAAAFEDVAVTPMRKIISARLTESKQTIPHYYVNQNCYVDELLQLRKRLNADIASVRGASEGEKPAKVTINDFIVKACAMALREMPEVNCSYVNNMMRHYKTIDINVAVSVADGLITPLLRDVDKTGLLGINTAMKGLIAKSKAGKLLPEEYASGSMTVSNLGMYGIPSFSAIINPPQSCILAIGGLQKVVVPDEKDDTKFAVKSMISLSLSCDHRVMDGVMGANFVNTVKKYLENPRLMLL